MPDHASGDKLRPLPAHLLQLLRPLSLEMPELELMLHANLIARGFLDAEGIAKLLVSLQEQGRALLPLQHCGHMGYGRLCMIVKSAADLRLTSQRRGQTESGLVALAAYRVLLPGLSSEEERSIRELIDTLFESVQVEAHEKTSQWHAISVAVRANIDKREGVDAILMQNDDFVEKAVQLHVMLISASNASSLLLLGPSGAGKSLLRSFIIDHLKESMVVSTEMAFKGLWRRAGDVAKDHYKGSQGQEERFESPKTAVIKMVLGLKNLSKNLKSTSVEAGFVNDEKDLSPRGDPDLSCTPLQSTPVPEDDARQSAPSKGSEAKSSINKSPLKNMETAPRSELQVIFPQAVGLDELIGCFVRFPHQSDPGNALQAATPEPTIASVGSRSNVGQDGAVQARKEKAVKKALLRSAALTYAKGAEVFEDDASEADDWLDDDHEDGDESQMDESLMSEDDARCPPGIHEVAHSGVMQGTQGQWQDGLLTSFVRRLNADRQLQHPEMNRATSRSWLVLDGDLHGDWAEMLVDMFFKRKLVLSNGEALSIPYHVTVVIEAQDAANASPALVAHSAVLALSESTISWQSLLRAWLKQQADRLPRNALRQFQRWADVTIEPTLISMRKQQLIPCSGAKVITEQRAMQNMLHLLSSIVRLHDHGSDSGPFVKVFDRYVVFSYIWAFGGDLPIARRNRFEPIGRKFIEAYIKDFPPAVSLFEFLPESRGAYLRPEQSELHPMLMPLAPLSPELPLFAPTSQAAICSFLLQVLTAENRNVLITGERGCGKSLLLRHFCRRRKYEESQPEDLYVTTEMRAHASSDAPSVQRTIESNVFDAADNRAKRAAARQSVPIQNGSSGVSQAQRVSAPPSSQFFSLGEHADPERTRRAVELWCHEAQLIFCDALPSSAHDKFYRTLKLVMAARLPKMKIACCSIQLARCCKSTPSFLRKSWCTISATGPTTISVRHVGMIEYSSIHRFKK
ncbi:hypothetical protein AB1Y20_013190 [Prymnesium parvum]|uniref:Origin recognition complex subunit 4 n=1 Tax=Prymnesium parvum TaxID=97485 RepID=A0AB34IM22_PRYPA